MCSMARHRRVPLGDSMPERRIIVPVCSSSTFCIASNIRIRSKRHPLSAADIDDVEGVPFAAVLVKYPLVNVF